MERLLPRLAVKLATRRSRRLVPTRGRGRVDPRRSFRDAVETDGEFLRLARRARAIEEPRLVVLCDTSGSMDPHSRFLLSFLLSLKKVARRTELFAFNTRLGTAHPVDLSRPARPDARAAGRRRSGLVRRHADRPSASPTSRRFIWTRWSTREPTSSSSATGSTAGTPRPSPAAMRAIASRARRVIWLNPLLGDPRYEPTQKGMEAALPFVSILAPAHNLESLERLIPMLAA